MPGEEVPAEKYELPHISLPMASIFKYLSSTIYLFLAR